MNDLISIIVSVYNVELYLKECLNSIITQTYKNLEIILIDDGSTDLSGIICDEYAKNDKRIIIIHNFNHGVSYSRNIGIKMCTGKFVTFIDGDDKIDENFIKNLYTVITEQKCDLAACDFLNYTRKNKYINSANNKYTFKINSSIDIIDNFNLLNNYIYGYCWNKMYKTEIIRKIKFSNNITMLEDLLFVYEYIKKCNMIVVINKKLYYYRQRRKSAINNYKLTNTSAFIVLNTLYKNYKNDPAFKKLYLYFSIKYKKCLNDVKDIIYYDYKFKNLNPKLKIVFIIYNVIPRKIVKYVILLKQKMRFYFD